MLNIHELEQKWIRYKIKSYIPYIVIILSITLIVTAIYLFFPLKTAKHTPVKKQITVIEKNITKISSLKINKPTEEIVPKKIKQPKRVKQKIIKKEENKRVILHPSMNFLHHLESTDQQINSSFVAKVPVQIDEKQKKRVKISSIKTAEERYPTKQQKTTQIKDIDDKKTAIIIKRKESENDIKEVITRFQKNNNPALSLFAAKKYYELENYKQAYNYALITNKINNDIEESWLIFAKALVKLGEKEKAIKTLQSYIEYSHSSNAQILLDEIQRGKFK